MPKYRKKPVVVEAEVYRLGLEDGFDCYAASCPFGRFAGNRKVRPDACVNECGNGRPFIKTLEGIMRISEGDYVITGVKGEKYPCKPDIFEATYELVE